MPTTASGYESVATTYTEDWAAADQVIIDSAEAVIREAGIPRFADSAARAAAITAPTLGMKTVLTSDEITYRHNGTTWKAWESDWTSYTPTLTNITLGTSGTVTGSYKYEVGDLRVKCTVTLGTSGFSVASGCKFTTPVTIPAVAYTKIINGELSIRDVSATTTTISKMEQLAADTDKLTFAYFGASNVITQVTGTAPITFAASDILEADVWIRMS